MDGCLCWRAWYRSRGFSVNGAEKWRQLCNASPLIRHCQPLSSVIFNTVGFPFSLADYLSQDLTPLPYPSHQLPDESLVIKSLPNQTTHQTFVSWDMCDTEAENILKHESTIYESQLFTLSTSYTFEQIPHISQDASSHQNAFNSICNACISYYFFL